MTLFRRPRNYEHIREFEKMKFHYVMKCPRYVAASTLRRYSYGLRLAIAPADARPAMPASFR